jgi:(p)ppGpp synthase/HD superfamily hydrolase
MFDIIKQAEFLATIAHAAINQKRKYTGEDYIVHPWEVVNILRNHADPDDNQIAAAWMHDVVEDTHITLSMILVFFSEDVASLVEQVTDVSKPEDGNRAERKRIDREHIAKCSARAADIKLADLISNTKSIIERDPEFAKVYMVEKRELLKVLQHGNKKLLSIATEIVEGYFKCQQ